MDNIIYIRKLSYPDAKQKLLQGIESFFFSGCEIVKVVHGVGTYTLRNMAIQELSKLDYVEIIEDPFSMNPGELKVRLLIP